MAKRSEGTYVVIAKDKVFVESSEIKALRLAVVHNGESKFVPYGQEIHQDHASTPEAVAPKPAAVSEVTPAAVPAGRVTSDAETSGSNLPVGQESGAPGEDF